MSDNVDELLHTHADRVTALKAALGNHLSKDVGCEVDELWLMRFLLSHELNVQEAAAAAEKAIEWRLKNMELIQCAREKKPAGEFFGTINQYVCADFHDKRSKDGEPFYIVRAGISNAKACMDRVAHEQMLAHFMYKREQMFALVDQITRETRRLVKVISVNDLNHVSLFNGQDKRFMKVLSAASKQGEDLFPQLMGRSVLINMPQVYYSIFSLMKTFMSKRTLAKLAVCPAGDDITKCPFIKAKFNIDDVPSFLGGKCKCSRGCVGSIPNEQSQIIGERGDDGSTTKVVGARDKHIEVLAVEAEDVVAWELKVEDKGVDFSASLKLDNGEELSIMEVQKIKSTSGVQGTFPVKSKGVITFTFDNSYSLINSKTVTYTIRAMNMAEMKDP
eukprot:gene745-1213_t